MKIKPFKSQLLKWIGNKQKHAVEIIKYFPTDYNTYFEPFLGSGGILGTLAPSKAIASDIYVPLMEIWNTLHNDPDTLKEWYMDRYKLIDILGKKEAYSQILNSFNNQPNGKDFIFLLRACYGGVVRFRQKDGFMSTPCGVHKVMNPHDFSKRVTEWHIRTKNTIFKTSDFANIMDEAQKGDLIYCDPPYIDSQTILYGAHTFSLEKLLHKIEECKQRGVYVALSIDGTKYSGQKLCNIPIPKNLFVREEFIEIGRSMLKRFQMNGQSLEEHEVTDRLLLTY